MNVKRIKRLLTMHFICLCLWIINAGLDLVALNNIVMGILSTVLALIQIKFIVDKIEILIRVIVLDVQNQINKILMEEIENARKRYTETDA